MALHLEYLDEKHIAVITLDDLQHANAMSPEMGDEFSQAIRQIQAEPGTRAVVIRGAGRDFSIGGHRDMLIKLGSREMSEAQLCEFMLGFYNRWLPILDLDIPVISALQGDCIGVAPVFACASDIAVADESLNLQVTFAGLALYPGMALPYLLERKVGASRAAYLMMTDRAVSGREAERLGLVERCVAPGTAFDEALQVARDIAAAYPATIRLLKARARLRRTDLQAELESNARQQAADILLDDYRKRIAGYLPNHYD
jgi:enoyl-CoA hydratase/carnithine racemase